MQKEEIQKIKQEALSAINQAETVEELEALKVKYLGRKAYIHQLFRKMGSIPPADRALYGQLLNEAKQAISQHIEEKIASLQKKIEYVDLSFPGKPLSYGGQHILRIVNNHICRIFEEIGFRIREGREIEDEWHNFSALNIPLEHPSRENFDTFYLKAYFSKDKVCLLRSHTSPSQIRVMENEKPPLAIISPGRVYRPDQVDASHSFMFHQIEGFCVDTDINFSHLKGVLLYFAKKFFGEKVTLRFRPHFFPFTEPSAEVDISCIICSGRGCSVCSHSGWLEILGCGMIHPYVLKNCNIDSKKYKGFAFGMGLERIVMLKYRINDIRLFFENDQRFLSQFYDI